MKIPVKQKTHPPVTPFAGGIRGLRRALGETQEGMARKLGVSLRGYTQWERGETYPRGKRLLQLLALCPDDQTRQSLFGLRPEALSPPRPRPMGRKPTSEQEDLLRHYNDAVTGINLLYEAADAGHEGARRELEYLADLINKRAGDWRRMKYLKR